MGAPAMTCRYLDRMDRKLDVKLRLAAAVRWVSLRASTSAGTELSTWNFPWVILKDYPLPKSTHPHQAQELVLRQLSASWTKSKLGKVP